MHVALLLLSLAQDPSAQKPYTPQIAPASDEGQKAMALFQLPPGFVVEPWAAEPMLANPVAIYPADTGEVYVCESFRLHKGVTDIREHMDWLDDDNASRTVEDEVAMFKKHLDAEGWAAILTERERVRLLRDTNGDGKADQATVFDDRFGDPADGIGAGVLKWGQDVYFTNMPHLWLLRDENGDDRADVHTSLAYGFGVHVQFLGHDLHGLAMGPDGFLYFSCGDRGFNVHTPNGVLESIDCGAVLRCEPDGSNLEIYHTGLRNPQELAFNAFGDLFTGDNNGDGGDQAKWIEIVRGADSGWRNGWQWVNEPTPRGFFNEEKLWAPHFDGQAAYLIPPIANIGDGPSGVTYNPGTGLPPEYDGHFLMCDFRGEASYSLIWDIAMKPKGAGYELVEKKPFLKNTLVTDCDFGPDGALYFSDWVSGWGQTGKGRIYRAFDPRLAQSKDVLDVKRLLNEGLSKRAEPELEGLLSHKDLRIRLRAELELAHRGPKGFEALRRAAQTAPTLFGRLHGVWGMGAAARWDKSLDANALDSFLSDKEPEVRAQAVRMLGDLKHVSASGKLEARVSDPEPRVRLRAAIALAETGSVRAADALLAANNVSADDGALRSAVEHALSRCAKPETLAEHVVDPFPARRLACVVALRLQKSPRVADFLGDSDPLVVAEAARAIYDVPIPEALPALARRARLAATGADDRAPHHAQSIGSELTRTHSPSRSSRCGPTPTSTRARRRSAARQVETAARSRHPARPVASAARARRFVPAGDRRGARAGADRLRTRAGRARLGRSRRPVQGRQCLGLVRDLALDAKKPGELRVAALRASTRSRRRTSRETLKLALGDSLDAVRAAALPILLRLAPRREGAALPRDRRARQPRRAPRRLRRARDAPQRTGGRDPRFELSLRGRPRAGRGRASSSPRPARSARRSPARSPRCARRARPTRSSRLPRRRARRRCRARTRDLPHEDRGFPPARPPDRADGRRERSRAATSAQLAASASA